MKTAYVSAMVLVVLTLGAAPALADNNPSVTGGFTCQAGYNTFKVNITAVQHKDGSVTGRFQLHQTYDDGSLVIERTADEPIDELVIVGNRAYGRAGNNYFAVQDSGEGSNDGPDLFMPLFFVSSPPPPLALFLGFFGTYLPIGGLEVTLGNLQVRD